jgi:hypothetical protein
MQPTRGATTMMMCAAIMSFTLSPLSAASASAQEPSDRQNPQTQQESQALAAVFSASALASASLDAAPMSATSAMTPAQGPSFSFSPTQDASTNSERPWSLWRTTRQVALDPTTYAPAVISYVSTKLDWDTSQVFFRNGYVEGNPRFTISGNPNDTPLSYGRGDRMILSDTLQTLGGSLANNFLTRTMEQVLLERYPQHPRIVRTIGWVERSVFASYWSYRLSASHFRQWKLNEQMAAVNGLR